MKKLIKELTDQELERRIEEVENEIAALEDHIGNLNTERFYRNNPECRPKEEVDCYTDVNS